DRQVDDAAGRIDGRCERPHVRARTVLPAVAPGLVERLAGTRYRLEFPKLLAGPRAERAGVAGRTLRHFTDGGADDRDVAIDRRRPAVRHANVYDTGFAEALRRPAVGRADRDQ